ncbi:hypothetical protein CAOG_01256 [Capsaspora owczarzaki ATCC 30864]|uniref:FAD dependent oxidoreductase domain-containing protein n=1 Tax=Capsaspora owczarzaki (strain ATCC 30864) TaxID=595528 RepID=A0A0D2VIL4_CAPO3|nr:hypothetical protein CAOG_01256 [Capsaspora owczarzaki ATCC 30864]KJE89832.1 hypothetical protein CAOG_001256 [Capsaspora owczarzaki ATCC 30864]|eukprot:XP_004349776.2 hypothetical protein CAOG_01256 [Capsaspora owczarzaki ATCC 30864]
MSDEAVVPCVIIGGGVMGLSAACAIQERRAADHLSPAVLMEQHQVVEHKLGSSHGPSRITRTAYTDPVFAKLMKRSHQLWHHLAASTDVPLFSECGGLMIGQKDAPAMTSVIQALKETQAPFEILQPAECNRRFPGVELTESYIAVVDNTAGVLFADRIISTLKARFVAFGGTLCCDRRVVSLDVQSDDRIVITSQDGNPHGMTQTKSTEPSFAPATFTTVASRVVLAVGAWLPSLLAQAPIISSQFVKAMRNLQVEMSLDVQEVTVSYWKIKPEFQDAYSLNKGFPVFIDMDAAPGLVYGLPEQDKPGYMKLCLHRGPSIAADGRSFTPAEEIWTQFAPYVDKLFPGLDVKTPPFTETCMYTMTKDEHFLIDRHPQHRNLIIAGGFSGHGFKLSPVVGEMLAQLALDAPLAYDMAPFSFEHHWKVSSL